MLGLIPYQRRGLRHRRGLSDIDTMLDRMFSDFIRPEGVERVEVPSFNILKEGDNLIIEASVPGYNKDNIKVELNDDILTVTGEMKEEEKKEEKDYYYREFKTGSFSRSVRIPEGVKPEDLQAKFQDGVLKITMPYKEEEMKSKSQQINIQ